MDCSLMMNKKGWGTDRCDMDRGYICKKGTCMPWVTRWPSGWRAGHRIERSGSSSGRVIVSCSWARHFTLTVPLSTQEYKWVPAKCWGVTCDGLVSHPGGIAIFLVA